MGWIGSKAHGALAERGDALVACCPNRLGLADNWGQLYPSQILFMEGVVQDQVHPNFESHALAWIGL